MTFFCDFFDLESKSNHLSDLTQKKQVSCEISCEKLFAIFFFSPRKSSNLIQICIIVYAQSSSSSLNCYMTHFHAQSQMTSRVLQVKRPVTTNGSKCNQELIATRLVNVHRLLISVMPFCKHFRGKMLRHLVIRLLPAELL